VGTAYHWRCFSGTATEEVLRRLREGGQTAVGKTLFKREECDEVATCAKCESGILIGESVVTASPRKGERPGEYT
jgi:hypothetical protein